MKIIASLIILGILTSCSPYRIVNNHVDKEVDFKNYKTFSFTTDIEVQGLTRDIKNSSTINEIKRAISSELKSRGYHPDLKSDLLVNIGLVVQEKIQTRETNFRDAPRYVGQRRYSWKSETVEVGRYKEGTLSVDLVDVKQNRLVWEAAVTTVLDKDSHRPENVDKAVRALFRKFPE
ncbi:protein of unknown function [Pseudarcicella hirudinis]|uniref:DUF4136 domain-containing protein n=1 Tax=Pseudarcicella hirudinis TaxID=1079859 RepID=A0A1I5M2Z1_9BACT|nr:DUF4136 domain-containing protein [Pseudarcicella hirudinis]SFP04008.1 protein of unknown function [Pseudarcicella hirudinis]